MNELLQQADDFAGIVAMATGGQQQTQNEQQQTTVQQTPIQQHFNQNNVTGAIPGPQDQVAKEAISGYQTKNIQQEQTELQQDKKDDEKKDDDKKNEFKLDEEIDSLLEEFGIKQLNDNQSILSNNNDISEQEKNDEDDSEKLSKKLEKNKKIDILLEKLTTERDELMEKLTLESYEKEQYKLAAEKLRNKVEELLAQKTALEYDENKLPVPDEIKDFVHFYNKRSSEKDKYGPDSVLTKRMLAEAIRIVEGITKINLDNYLSEYYLRNNPQIPKIGNNHSSILNIDLQMKDPNKRSFEEKKADPNWNPMENIF